MDVILEKQNWGNATAAIDLPKEQGRTLAVVFPALHSCGLLASFIYLVPTASNCIIFHRLFWKNMSFESMPLFFTQSFGFFNFIGVFQSIPSYLFSFKASCNYSLICLVQLNFQVYSGFFFFLLISLGFDVGREVNLCFSSNLFYYNLLKFLRQDLM